MSDLTNQKGKSKGIKHSIFFITVNSNKSEKSADYATVKQKMNNIFAYIFNNQNVKKYIIERYTGEVIPDSKISDISVEYAFETGNKMKRLHGHAIVKIDHYSNVQFNLSPFRQVVNQYMGYTVYVNVSSKRDPTKDLQDYILKED